MAVQLWGISLAIGILFISAAILVTIAGLTYLVTPLPDKSPEENRSAGITLLSFSVVCWITALIPFGYGFMGYAKDKRLRQVADYLKLYRRITMEELARKMNTSEFEAEKLLLDCIDRGYIDAHVDRATGEIFIKGTVSESYVGVRCPNCGRLSTRIVMRGETRVCEYCGSVLPIGSPYPGTADSSVNLQNEGNYSEYNY